MSILNALSFDIEDWFQVENLKGAIAPDQWDACDLRVVQNSRKILSLLEKNGTKATFFVLGWIAEKCPGLVKEIAEQGHEIASHGYGHELVYKQTPKMFHNDISRSKAILESITGRQVLGYRAPSFSITPETPWALDILKDLDFVYDSSIFPTSFHDRYGFNGSSRFPFRFENGLIEMPLSTVKVRKANVPIAGGGYFRLYPYSLFRYCCKRLNRDGKSVVFYLHPWELDPEQPRVNIRYQYRFRHYVNLGKTEKRLARLLADFRFGPIGDVALQYFPELKHGGLNA
ncbi:Polysaccharide deactylase family protein, PEP-CTERM locus subfamily [Candidatus Sulfobium mesophilum]|uniref:Polysaccharide deactylase family protein, PEP-CTERM locus subfamily n=1 Tax=Candidatus Sulfobium mesophilum TaxID=2016548 RepID=A0A2U3QDL5_9BACT|nr:Polysaccharide deactylase family protein, PEP-CTERM locus subfamily [Candidatus Sulfobium mesophilum]